MKYLLKLNENKYQEVDGKYKGMEYVHGKLYEPDQINPQNMNRFEPAEFPSMTEDDEEKIRADRFFGGINENLQSNR